MTQPPLCYPHPAGTNLHRPPPSDLHETGGLPDNWALDFMAPGGTPVLASQAATVRRLSGHDPALGELPGAVFAWTIYLETVGGVEYFITHLGDRTVHVGQPVRLGQVIGHVGHWPHDPARSHTHEGITHPAGKVAAVARIDAIARAPMVRLPGWPPL